MQQQEHWTERAACAGKIGEFDVPDWHRPSDDYKLAPQARICRACPVRDICNTEAVAHHDTDVICAGKVRTIDGARVIRWSACAACGCDIPRGARLCDTHERIFRIINGGELAPKLAELIPTQRRALS